MGRPRTSLEQKQAAMREKYAPDSGSEPVVSLCEELHFSPAQVGKMWGIGPDKAREMFRHESGVLVLGGDGGRGKRGYSVLRIPKSVVERVHRRLSNP